MGHPVQQPQHGYLCWIPGWKVEGQKDKRHRVEAELLPSTLLFLSPSSAIVGTKVFLQTCFPEAFLCWECFGWHWFSLLRSILLSIWCYSGSNSTKRKSFNPLSFHIKMSRITEKSSVDQAKAWMNIWRRRKSLSCHGQELPSHGRRLALWGSQPLSWLLCSTLGCRKGEKVGSALNDSSWLFSGTWFSGHGGRRQGTGYFCSLGDSLPGWAGPFPWGWRAAWAGCTGVCGETSPHC